MFSHRIASPTPSLIKREVLPCTVTPCMCVDGELAKALAVEWRGSKHRKHRREAPRERFSGDVPFPRNHRPAFFNTNPLWVSLSVTPPNQSQQQPSACIPACQAQDATTRTSIDVLAFDSQLSTNANCRRFSPSRRRAF